MGDQSAKWLSQIIHRFFLARNNKMKLVSYEASSSRSGNYDGAYLANSVIASSASTPPVMSIGAKGAFAATSLLESMIWSILVAS